MLAEGLKFLRAVESYTMRDRIRNSEVAAEPQIYSYNLLDRILENIIRKWIRHMNRMDGNILPVQVGP